MFWSVMFEIRRVAGWLEKPSNAGKEVVKVAAEEARLSWVILIKSRAVSNVVWVMESLAKKGQEDGDVD